MIPPHLQKFQFNNLYKFMPIKMSNLKKLIKYLLLDLTWLYKDGMSYDKQEKEKSEYIDTSTFAFWNMQHKFQTRHKFYMQMVNKYHLNSTCRHLFLPLL